MLTKPLTATNFNVSNSTPQNFQIPQSYSVSENEPPQNYSAPGSPTKLSPKHTLNPYGPRQALSPSSAYNPLMPQRANTENNDNQVTSLFDVYNKTEGYSVEESITSHSAKKSCNGGNFKRLVDDMKGEKRSLSAEKTYKCGSPVSRTIGLWSKENVPEGSEKSVFGVKRKPRNSTEQVNRSVGGEAVIRFDNRKLKSTRRDVDSDVETNGRYNTEEEGIEGLFDEDYYEKEAMRDGPIRYSKMSEEDAATIFEIRRKELLSFLTRLGASSAVSKKKFVNKNPGGSRLGNGQNSDTGKNDFHREKGIRRLQDSLKENNSPTRFIIYNTTSDSNTLWNTNTSSQAVKFATPGKEKKLASAIKVGCESAPDEKRRNSVKAFREREELNPLVERNLEASFNQTMEWNDGEKRSPVKVMKKTESTMKSYEEKVDAIENITIDLTKVAKSKKKKAKKVKNEEEKGSVSEKLTLAKQVSEDMGTNQGYDQSEGQVENMTVHKNLEVIKKKNQSVMNEIADLDGEIERMRESDNRVLLSYRRVEDERDLAKKREEAKRNFYAENPQEGYSNAARMKKNAERSRSMSIKQLAVRENSKHNESMHENYNRGGLKNRENISEEEVGNQSRRNQKVRFADDLTTSSKNSSQISQKETKEKGLVRVASQTNTSDTLKVDLNKPNKTQAPVQKRALSNNANISRISQQDSSVTLSTISSPKNNSKDFKLKNLDLGKANAGLNHSFNAKTSQTTTNKSSEKNKLATGFDVARGKEAMQPLKTKKISRTSETTSTLQSVRESLLTSPKELTFSLRKTPVSCSTPIPVVKKELSNGPTTKPAVHHKKSANKSISIKSNYRSVSDKDYSTEIPNLFESATPLHEPASAVPKISFTKEIKKPTREGSNDKRPSAPVAPSKPKQNKPKEQIKVVKDVQLKGKKGEANRPDFDLNSSNSIRAKILRQARPGQENLSFLKASASPSNLSDSSKLDMKPFALEDFGISPAASQVKKLPFKKSETDKNLLRKGSLSTPRGFKVVTSPTATTTRGGLGISLLDIREKLAEQACAEMDEDNESLDSFRLREKSLNLPLQPAGKQGQDAQTLKRKKAAGYSVC